MSPFELHLQITPAFHRPCSIRIEGKVNALTTFEAHSIGLLPRAVLALPVESSRIAILHACCSSMLTQWEDVWSQSGCDGVCIDGIFSSSDAKDQAFMLWSPERGSAGYAMLAAALDCFPFERCSGVAGELLEMVRSYLELQPPVIVLNEVPLRLRFAPGVHAKDASEIEKILGALPQDGDLIVDLSGVERLGRVLGTILPMVQFLKRRGVVRWLVQSVDTDGLLGHGVEPSTIETVQHVPISAWGNPIVFGGLEISSPELIALAKNGTRIELVSALRRKYGMTIEQAAIAARELLGILAANPT
jgi:hypothetical protein